MRRVIAFLLFIIMLLSVCGCSRHASLDIDATAAEQAKSWMELQIKNNSLFSFSYDGVAYEQHIRNWEKSVESTDEGWNVTYVSKDGVTFDITVLYDEQHAALDWVGSFTHNGATKSGVIGNVMMLDSDFAIKDAIMTTANSGGMDQIDDGQAYETNLVEVGTFQVKNRGGRSSQDAWPFFDITSGEDTYGIMGAIGWTGNWQATYTYDNGNVHVQAGMQNTNYYMEPEETLRTPSIVIQFFKGTQDQGHNAWRKLILANYNPVDVNGNPVTYAPISINTWGGYGSDRLCKIMQKVVDSGQYFEYQWIDAGWYGDYQTENSQDYRWASQLGNYYYNPGYEGVGFKDVSALAQENDYGLLVWFEISRAYLHTDMYQEHQELFLPLASTSTGDNAEAYLDFGNPDAVQYALDIVLGLMDEMGSDFYRQDYNFDPDTAWIRKDNQLDSNGNRAGVTEIKYVTGHYDFLDAIIASGRQIDNCASGGCRIDIEMTKRSIPLWRTDYTAATMVSHKYASGVYSLGAGMSWWLVHHGGANSTEGSDSEYGFRAFMASGATMYQYTDQTHAKKMLDELLYNRQFINKDFYILTQGYGDETDMKNAGYEYHDPEKDQGYLVCFRPLQSNEEHTVFKLRGLDEQAVYTIRIADTEETHEYTGLELMEQGLRVYFPRVQVSHMIYFERK